MTKALEHAIEHLGGQKAVATACNVSQNAVSKWLNGKTRVSLSNALKIEQATKGKVKAQDFNSDYAHLLGR